MRIPSLKFAALAAVITLPSPFAFGANETSARPNIVLILADDLGYGDLGCYGQKLIRTPNIDALAADGMRFTQAYAGGPVCTPSRSVLMTGLHGGHTPARDNVPHYPTYLDDADVTVAEVLKGAGYRTFGIGKWSLGDPGTPGSAMNQGFDHWLGYLNQDHAHYYFTEYLDKDEGRRELPGNPLSKKHYSHDLMTDQALDYIREAKDMPFFLFAAYTVPHFSATEEDADGLAVPDTEPYSNRDWPDKAKKYAAMVHRLDRDVGRIRALINELGLAGKTLIIFSSDNGGHSTVWKDFQTSGPLRGYKRDLFEGGIRVPLIANWPGTIPAGTVSEEVAAFQDLLPTFADLAGATAPKGLDGISLVDTLKGEKTTIQRDFLYWDYGHNRRFYDQAVRLGSWKGIRLGKDSGRMQLYDLGTDIAEKNDVAGQHPDVVGQIAAIMDRSVSPNARYPIGEVYKGGAIWLAENHHPSALHLPAPAKPGDPGFEAAEFIFDPAERPTPQCHSSSLVELPDHQLAATWFGGTNEPHVDNSIWFSRQIDGRWQKPVEVVDGSEGENEDLRTGNPVLFQPGDGPLLLFYKVAPRENSRASAWHGMMTRSHDGGNNWETPRRLGSDPKLGTQPQLIGPVKNKPLQLPDGSIICPSSTEHAGWRVHFEITRDLGETWEVIGPINNASNFNVIQPSLLTHTEGKMQILCRSKEGVVAQSWSEDGGKSWSPFSATHLPNPNSGTDAVTLADGRHLLVYNHTLKGAPFPSNRQMLNVAISTDGTKWKPVLTLEQEKGEFSYPAVIQTTDGKIHITYTWKRETIKHVVLDPKALPR